MRTFTSRRGAATMAGAAALALTLAACGGANDLGGGSGGGGGGDDKGGDCSEFEAYGKHEGKKVSITSSIREKEADQS
ncbi:hypothetical protein [Bowdeniella nasicola]|nr:hypothetical protein [Bowdeniella nasicola]